MKVSGQLDEPLVVALVTRGVAYQFGQAGHDGGDGSLGEVGGRRPVQGILFQVSVRVENGLQQRNGILIMMSFISVQTQKEIKELLPGFPLDRPSCNRRWHGTWPIPV